MMKRLGWIPVMALTSMLFACAGTDDADSSGGDEEAALQHESAALKIDPDPCSLVRCRAGTQCEVINGRARCIPEPECASDSDCRLFSNYCDGCGCLALSNDEVNPVCGGQIVACFVDPCMGKAASCVRGQCVLGGGAASF